jgi:hypothetical protein
MEIYFEAKGHREFVQSIFLDDLPKPSVKTQEEQTP